MNHHKKAEKLFTQSIMEKSSDDIEVLAINLKMGKPYGLDVHFQRGVYVIARHEQVVFECLDYSELCDVTWAIVRFLDISALRQKVA